MKRVVMLLMFASLSAIQCNAQTTYQQQNVPFACDAATLAQVPLTFGMFSCRGMFYADNTIELFFWGSRIELFQNGIIIGPYNTSISLTDFTQPVPAYCPVRNRVSGCPNGTEPGTLTFSYSGTDSNGNQHSGLVTATWINVQSCGGGRFCWYRPIIESSSITINQ